VRTAALHRRAAVLVCLALIVSGLTAAPVAPAGAQAGGDVVEQLLPTGARQLLAAVRVLEGISTRNRTYREAHEVQGQLRSWYDARIETAQQQLLDREQLGLGDSQVRAYGRVVASLRAERDAAIDLTEDEKRAAKYRFEGRVRSELFGALLRTPKGQEALLGIRDTVEDLRENFGRARAALEGGNPISALTQELQRKVDRFRTAAEILSVVSGRAGAELRQQAARVERLIGDVDGAVADVVSASDDAIAGLDGALSGIDAELVAARSPRAAMDVLLSEVAADAAERLFTPGGEAPVEDVIADAIARGFDEDLVQNIGVAVGEIDPATLATMRDRVRARLLADRLDDIAGQCGRLTGALHVAAGEVLAAGASADPSTPCRLFRNPEALRDFVERLGRGTGDAEPSLAGLDGTYTGDRLDRVAGAIVEVLSTEVVVTVNAGEVTGRIVESAVTNQKDGARTKIEKGTQTIEFTGTVTLDGRFTGAGRTTVVYELLSCEPADECEGVGATQSARPEGVEVSLTGTVTDGIFSAEIVNSVSGATASIEARRQP